MVYGTGDLCEWGHEDERVIELHKELLELIATC